MRPMSLLVLASLALTGVLAAQDGKPAAAKPRATAAPKAGEAKPAEAPPAQDPAAAPKPADAAPEKPVPEHALLGRWVGEWDAELKSMRDGKLDVSKGRSTSRMLGGFWLITDFAGTAAGQPLMGHEVLGYDPHRKKFVSTWVDGSSVAVTMSQGSFDATGAKLTMQQTRLMSGQMVQSTAVYNWKDADSFSLRMTGAGAEGKEEVLLVIDYTRRK